MTRYYYDCPIKALYMMREFGVKIEQWKFIAADHEPKLDDVWQQHIIQELHDYNVKTYREDFFYVAKESESIFEPKEGDISLQQNNEFIFASKIAIWCSEQSCWTRQEPKKPSRFLRGNQTIIMRNNKQFFACEVEND